MNPLRDFFSILLPVQAFAILSIGFTTLETLTQSGAVETGEQAMTHAVGLAILGLAIPILGYLLKRAIDKNDEAIDKASKESKEAIADVARDVKELLTEMSEVQNQIKNLDREVLLLRGNRGIVGS